MSRILELGKGMTDLSDRELRERSDQFRQQVTRKRATLDEVAPGALALVRETARRKSGLLAYEEQVMGALILARGGIAELATGEGKTLVAALAAYLFALEEKGVHVATVNSYLAERDFSFASSILEEMGVTVGHLPERGAPEDKRSAYACDVTYGVGYEFGFDYLRDQLARMRSAKHGATQQLCGHLLRQIPPQPEVVQRPLSHAIVDEIDSVLIDEAGSPLVISEAVFNLPEADHAFRLADQVSRELQLGTDYTFHRSKRRPNLSPSGIERIHAVDEIPWRNLRRPWKNYILNGLSALHGFHRDVHYVVLDDKVVIVDEFTGRAHEERSWNGGLHQAINAKEGLPIQPELESSASITRQRYYSLYQTISGLTGTAREARGEFKRFFKLEVVPVPLHVSNRRVVESDRAFGSQAALLDAVVEEIIGRHGKGQPLLVGTRSIKVSEAISKKLKAAGLKHRILTAKEDREENDIVANAGKVGSILIATNMAGRGTHIALTAESLAKGGLHVIGVERNDSFRIDRQLIGRCARQGEPGSAQFFVSLEDALFDGKKSRVSDREIVPADPVVRAIFKAQARHEKRAYLQRQLATERDRWIDQTREALA